MFSWGGKRQRKEEPQEAEEPQSPLAVCTPPAAEAIELAASRMAQASTALTAAAATGGEACPAAAAAAGGAACPGPGSSIELAARGSQLRALPLERASVRTKAAYFEALINSNTTAHVMCSVEGSQQCSYPSSGGGGGCGDALMLHADSSSGDEAEESWQDFSEVHMLLRIPRAQAAPAPGGGKYGSAVEMEALIEQLQHQLLLSEQQRKAAVDAYARRSGECENLMRVVRELTESRAKAAGQRASLAERYGELQQEYHRMLRIADLSRTVSKENLAQTSRTRSELRRVQRELHATKSQADHLSEKHQRVRCENLLLKEKVTLLERLDFVEESEVKKCFTKYRLAETY